MKVLAEQAEEQYESKLAAVKKEKEKIEGALELATKMKIRAVVKLEGVDANSIPSLENVRCKYYLTGEDNPVFVEVSQGYYTEQFKVTLDDLTARTHIRQLVLEDPSTGKTWIKENFMPFEPIYELKLQ